MSDTLNFIHFGCWNQGGCSKEQNNQLFTTHLSKVMRLLDKIVDVEKPEFITLAGDNYYPKKEGEGDKKKKIVNDEELTTGFDCLPRDIPIYLLFGNHDVDRLKKEQTEDECRIVKKQKSIIDRPYSNLLRPNHGNFIMLKLVGETLFLMIDTTIYTNDDMTCYKELFDLPEGVEIKKFLQDLQETEIISSLDRLIEDNHKISNIIIIGHHPIVCSKYKGEIKKIEPPLDNAFPLLFKILEKYPDCKYFYLCADLHNYQGGEIELYKTSSPETILKIHQEIVGTGGTKLDDAVPTASVNNTVIEHVSEYSLSYRIDPDKNKSEHGVLLCSLNKNHEVSFRFIGIDDQIYKTNGGSMNRGSANKVKKTKRIVINRKNKKTKRMKVKRTPLRITR